MAWAIWNLLLVNSAGAMALLAADFFAVASHGVLCLARIEVRVSAWQNHGRLVAIVSIVGAGRVWLFRRHKEVFFYYAAFFVLMVPYLNLLYIGIWVAERIVYFSSFLSSGHCRFLGRDRVEKFSPVLCLGVLTVVIIFHGDQCVPKDFV